jgi:hypothetical protein
MRRREFIKTAAAAGSALGIAVETSNSCLAGIGCTGETLIPKNTGRMMMTFMVHNQLHPSTQMTSLISTMANSICEDAKMDGEYVALPAVPPLYKPEVLGPWLIILTTAPPCEP